MISELTLLTLLSSDKWLLIMVIAAEKHSCKIFTRDGDKIADCSRRNLVLEVPQDLDEDITILDLSGNRLWKMMTFGSSNLGSFDRYKNLKVLIMKDMVIGRKPGDTVYSRTKTLFKNMYSLEIVDFANSSDNVQPDFHWPPNVRVINCSTTYFKDPAFAELKRLEKIYASSIPNMVNFPKFHALAKISVIDVYGNPIEDLTTDTISSLCFLDHLNVSSDVLADPKSYCNCKHLSLWTSNFHIKLEHPLKCKEPSGSTNCDLKFTNKQLARRRSCFGRALSENITSNWYKILPLVLVIILSLLIPSYLYARKYREAHHKLHHLLKHPPPTELSVTEEENPTDNDASDNNQQASP